MFLPKTTFFPTIPAQYPALASHAALHLHVLAADSAVGGDGVDAALRLKDAYARVTAEHYRAEARPAPFKSTRARQPAGSRTSSPPGSIHSAMQAVLANTLYFKGAWERKFDTSLTRDGTFDLPPAAMSAFRSCQAPCHELGSTL
ncbi:serpin-Z1-like [Panicum miliaceum]|uniref:Serpin-Z1-like n=1 Tax=Panicum miliaceum TaxID=4540 RepID=A0A3L6SIW2_PANMI|nr:serpin-Z1-like [Panicum miliaceum]